MACYCFGFYKEYNWNKISLVTVTTGIPLDTYPSKIQYYHKDVPVFRLVSDEVFSFFVLRDHDVVV